MADHESAKTAFLAYADEAGERAKEKLFAQNPDPTKAAAQAAAITAKIIFDEANELFHGKERIASLSLGDIILSRYPGTEPAFHVRTMIGINSMGALQPSHAIKMFRELIDEAPQSEAVRTVRRLLPYALSSARRDDEAVQAWVAYSDAATDLNEKACGYYNAAMFLKTRGGSYRVDALFLLRKVTKEYPASTYASIAHNEIGKLQGQLLPGLDQVGDPLDIEDALDVDDEFYLEEVPGLNDILGGQEMIDVL